ncbi:hypothetical protein QBC34DRAFT_411844 [Podospora aff. communis PSN243]|uniref:Uncharacterized protein n=1 Tax=Podospora aff. communis PSN243 TaxID=3040156 RepID=A0AAV9GDV5_9PEZI|nr:hypothetical protein QBC34DRAFT_411844 [Podospora aff. communis PSN243]
MPALEFRLKLQNRLCKLLLPKEKGAPSVPVVPVRHASLDTHTISTVSITHLLLTMPTVTSHSTPRSPSFEDGKPTAPNSKDTANELKAASDGETTQVLPTKYVRNIDNLVQVMQAIVGDKGEFQIEMRHTSYIVKSPIKIELKDLLERISATQSSFPAPDLRAIGPVLDPEPHAKNNHTGFGRLGLEEVDTGVSV